MTTDAVGGVWTYALDLARGLAEHGVRTTLAVLGPAPDGSQRADAKAIDGLSLIETGLPLDWTAESPAEVQAAGVRLAVLAAELRPDLIHLNSPALAAVARFSAPVVAVAHSCVATWWRAVEGSEPLPSDLAWRAELTGLGYRAAEAVLAPTHAFAEATAEAYGLATPPTPIWNGRAQGVFPAPNGQPAAFAFTAGRLWDEGKGLVTLDRAAAGLSLPVKAAGPLTGPNGARIDLAQVEPLGFLSSDSLIAVLRARPVFVSSAVYEPFGLAVLEAAQAGCALVLSDIPTLRELWDGAAVFVAPGDGVGFARAIEGVIAEPGGRDKLARAARRRAERYTVEAMVDGVLAIYGRLGGGVLRQAQDERFYVERAGGDDRTSAIVLSSSPEPVEGRGRSHDRSGAQALP